MSKLVCSTSNYTQLRPYILQSFFSTALRFSRDESDLNWFSNVLSLMLFTCIWIATVGVGTLLEDFRALFLWCPRPRSPGLCNNVPLVSSVPLCWRYTIYKRSHDDVDNLIGRLDFLSGVGIAKVINCKYRGCILLLLWSSLLLLLYILSVYFLSSCIVIS